MLDDNDRAALDAAAAAANGSTDLGDTGGVAGGGTGGMGSPGGTSGGAQSAAAGQSGQAQQAADNAQAQSQAQSAAPSPAGTETSTAVSGATGTLSQDLADNPGVQVAAEYNALQSPSANAATGVTGYGMPSQASSSFQAPGDMGAAAVQAAGYGTSPSPQQMAAAADQAYGLGPGVMEGVIQTESGWDPNANANLNFSSSHATGYSQLQPGTARGLGVTDISDPLQNIFGGGKLMGQLEDRYGNLPQAIGGYYAGPGHSMGYSPPGGGPTVGQHVNKVMGNIEAFNNGVGPFGQPSTSASAFSDPLTDPYHASSIPSPIGFDNPPVSDFGMRFLGNALQPQARPVNPQGMSPYNSPNAMPVGPQSMSPISGFGGLSSLFGGSAPQAPPSMAMGMNSTPATPVGSMLVGQVQPNGQIIGQPQPNPATAAGFGSALPAPTSSLAPIQTDFGAYKPTSLTNEQYMGQFGTPTFGAQSLITGQPTGYAPEKYSQPQIQSMLAKQAPAAPAVQAPPQRMASSFQPQTAVPDAYQQATPTAPSKFPLGPVRETGFGSPPTRQSSKTITHGNEGPGGEGDKGGQNPIADMRQQFPNISMDPMQLADGSTLFLGDDGKIHKVGPGEWFPTGGFNSGDKGTGGKKKSQETIDQNKQSLYGPSGDPQQWYQRQQHILLSELRRLGVRV